MTAFITGGGRGIGLVLAQELTHAGHRVAVTGRTPDPLHQAVAGGAAALALPGDATSRADVEAAVRRAEAELGSLDLVVANAGRLTAAGPLWACDPDEWWRDAEVNLRGPMLLLATVLRGMVARGRGRAVVVASGFATAPTPAASAYAASKAAVLRLVDSVAAELAGTGVSVFAVSPGLVATDMTEFPEPFLAWHPEMRGKARAEGRDPRELARLVLALASGRYDGLSGRFLHVRDDLDGALAAAQAPEPGTLRLAPWN